MSRRYPGLGGMMKEMFKDNPEDYRKPEDIDAEISSEEAELSDEEDPDKVVDVIPVGSEREKEELLNAEETLRDLRFGIVLLSIVFLPIMFFVNPHWRFAAGIAIGCVLALFLIQKIYQSVSTAVLLSPAEAPRYARKQVMIRYFITFAVLAATMFFGGIGMGAGTILATFTIKPAAYFQPWFRKLRRRFFGVRV